MLNLFTQKLASLVLDFKFPLSDTVMEKDPTIYLNDYNS